MHETCVHLSNLAVGRYILYSDIVKGKILNLEEKCV